ncbi:MAG: A/G-specific adenine glycosylase [Acidimicrobiia bacterium]|nr:A/G-specific adenine glycosylase [Acidimicrobiia bacterium]
MPDPAAAARNRALFAWYRRTRRDLPWRRDRDPWRVLVSEVMLQQTQVPRVAACFEEFLARFPTPEAMAATTPDRVVRVWVHFGLGYNTRARRLHAVARRIAAAGWPRTAADLVTLPGVGPYTAAAVASIAFGQRAVAGDTNVRRVVSRWVGRPLQGRELAVEATIRSGAQAGAWNQAVMDLGAMVCRPKPRCEVCPVAAWCTDPSVYVAPPRQSAFAGSDRQVRGAVLRALARTTTAEVAEIAEAARLPRDRVQAALASLSADGTIEPVRGGFRLSTHPSG